MTEPSEGARRAAETIIACIAEGGIILARDVTDAMASIIDRETHSAEMRKALEPVSQAIEKSKPLWQTLDSSWDRTKIGLYLTVPQLKAVLAALKGGAL